MNRLPLIAVLMLVCGCSAGSAASSAGSSASLDPGQLQSPSAERITAAAVSAQERGALPDELAWVGLFNYELLEWLENENSLEELCAGGRGSLAWHRCRAEHLEPKVMVIPVRSEPRSAAERRGEIVLVALPGQGFRAFVSASGWLAQPFTPDLYDGDWGYGPYYHQTILAREGSWFRIPLPALGAAWIDSRQWVQPGARGSQDIDPPIESIAPGQIIMTPSGDMLVLGIANGELRLRPEQPADMWCEAGDPPPLVPWQEIRLQFEHLFDARGHLLISHKYKRGC